MDFQHWQTKNKAIGKEKQGAWGRASFILNLGFAQLLPEVLQLTLSSRAERDCLPAYEESWSGDQRLCVKQDKAML